MDRASGEALGQAMALVQQLAQTERLPDGSAALSLDAAAEARIAAAAGASLGDVQRAALGAGIVPRRYLRNLRGYSPEQQLRLLERRAAMVGLGGLGGHLLEGLARMGVGAIRAADGDVFEEHNLNRQLLASTETLGLPKARAAMERARLVNPAVAVEAREGFLGPADLPGFLAGADLAVDALGGLALRLPLQRAAAAAGLPLVSGAMAGFTGWVAVVLPGQPGPAEFLGQGASAESGLGTPPASVATVAALMLGEAVRLLLGEASPLAGKMLLLDLKAMSFETMRLA